MEFGPLASGRAEHLSALPPPGGQMEGYTVILAPVPRQVMGDAATNKLNPAQRGRSNESISPHTELID